MIIRSISVLLLLGGGVPVGGGGRCNNKMPINNKIKEVFSHLLPRPLGTPPPRRKGIKIVQ